MSFLSNLVIPLVLCTIFGVALVQKVDILSAFSHGVLEGLKNRFGYVSCADAADRRHWDV